MYAETRPLSYGRVKQNMDGCLFVWMGKKNVILSYHGLQYVGLLRERFTRMLLTYYIGMCVFHERQHDIWRRRAYSQGFAKAVHMSNDRQHFDPA